MPSVELNKPVPDFEAPATGDQTIRLDNLKGQNVVIYFYPKDNTPGCTTEGQDFRDRMKQFEELDTVILGVSRDGLKAHENFRAKHEFPFHLISDKDEALCNLFNVIKLKKLYGKEYEGIIRSAFLIGANGKIEHAWYKISPKATPEKLLAALEDA